MARKLLVLLLGVLMGFATLAGLTSAATNVSEIYPCSSCHESLNLTGVSKASVFHGINLTLGAHKGLYCVNCHVPESSMMEMRGGVEVRVLGLHSSIELMELNKVCGSCHTRELEDYNVFAHGNTSLACSGSLQYIVGYKNTTYILHLCDDYSSLGKSHGKACVECHDPHQPAFKPLNIMPLPSERPRPPDQAAIVVGGVLSGVAGLFMIGLSLFLASRRRAEG